MSSSTINNGNIVPNVPTNLSVNSITANSAVVNFTSQPNIIGCYAFNNGTQFGDLFSGTSSVTLTGLTPSTTYNLSLAAYGYKVGLTAPTSNSTGSFTYVSGNTSLLTISGNSFIMLDSGIAPITAVQAAVGVYASNSITGNVIISNPMGKPNAFSNLANIDNNTIVLNGNILCSAYDSVNNFAYFGGNFNSIRYNNCTNIASFNYQWNSLGFLDDYNKASVNGTVKNAIYDSSNNIFYVGGSFTVVYDICGSKTANNIAIWNVSSNTWSYLGTSSSNGVNYTVNTLAFDNSFNVYVGCAIGYATFSMDAASVAGCIGFWNAATKQWSTVFASLKKFGFSSNAYCNTILLDGSNNQLYVGGNFSSYSLGTGDVNIYSLLKYDISSNSVSSMGFTLANAATINTIKLDNSANIYVGGGFSSVTDGSGTITVGNFAKWNTAINRWSNTVSSTSFGGTINSMDIDNQGAVYVTGSAGYVNDLSNTNTVFANCIAKWNPSISRWSVVGGNSANNGIVGGGGASPVFCFFDSSKNYLYVSVSNTGGATKTYDTSYSGRIITSGLAKFNTSTNLWREIDSPYNVVMSNSIVNTISQNTQNNTFMLGGSFANMSQNVNNIFGLSVISNKIFPIGIDVSNGTSGNVNAIVLDTSQNLYVAGNFQYVYDGSSLKQPYLANSVAKWNMTSSSWSLLGNGVGSGTVYSLALDNSNNYLYVSGNIQTINGGAIAANSIGLWKIGSNAWSLLGSSVGNGIYGTSVYSTTIDVSSNLYVGGNFTGFYNSSTTPTVTTGGIVKYSPKNNQWTPILSANTSSGANGTVFAMSYDSSKNVVYVGGNFTDVSDNTNKLCGNIAIWNVASNSWSIMGNTASNGVNGVVNSIQADISSQKVYVGGSFSSVNDASQIAYYCNNLATWDTSGLYNIWYPVGVVGQANNNGTNGTINTLTLNPVLKSVYVGGSFTQVTDASFSLGTSNMAMTGFKAKYNQNYGVNLIPATITNFNNINATFASSGSLTITDPSSNSIGSFTYVSGNVQVATIVGKTVFMQGAGTTTITGTQGISRIYSITSANTTLTIGKALPTYGYFNISTQVYTPSGTYTITAPISNSTGSFTYASGNTSVATIQGNNYVIQGAGTVTVTANQGADPNYLSSYTNTSLTISKASPTITNFTIPQQTFLYGGSFTLTDPTSNSTGAFSYTSGNVSIATVVGKTVFYQGAGTVALTAVEASSNNYLSGSITSNLVIVKTNPTFGTFTIPSYAFVSGGTFTITDPSSNSTGSFSYISGNTSVVTVSGKTVTMVGAGNAIVTATQTTDANYLSGTTTTTLVITKGTPTYGAFVIPSVNYVSGGTFQLTAPSSNSTGSFSYTSGNTSVVTVTGNTVTMINVGTVTITAQQAADNNYLSSSTTGSLTINHSSPTFGPFIISSQNYSLGGVYTITPPTTNSTGAFSFTSGNTSVATISGNTYIIQGAGNSVITATEAEDNNYGSSSVTATLVINKIAPTLGTFAIPAQTYLYGATYTLTAPSSNSTGAFSYTSGNTSVASIVGNVVSLNAAGNAIITATQLTDNNYLSASVNSTLTVNKGTPTLGVFTIPSQTFSFGGTYTITDPTSNSSGAFSYTSNNTGLVTVVGNTLYYQNIGTVTITASQSTTSNFVSTTTSTTFTLNALPPTLSTFTIYPQTFVGGAFFQVTPPISNSAGAFTYSSSNIGVAIPAGGNSITMTGVGSSIITATQTPTGNYGTNTISTLLYVTDPSFIFNAFASVAGIGINVNINGVILASVYDIYRNRAYFGGTFTNVTYYTGTSYKINNVFGYDPSANRVYPLGIDGSNGTAGTVNALALDNSGNLFVGGNFTYCYDSSNSSIRTNNVAKWDISFGVWRTLASGLASGVVNAMICEVSNNYLYVAGNITGVDGTGNAYNSIAKWNTQTSIWSALGNGLYPANGGGIVYAFATDSSANLYVGGNFTGFYNSPSAVTNASAIAKYSSVNNQWSVIGNTVSSGVDGTVYTIAYCSNNNFLAVGGSFTDVSDNANYAYNNVALWNISSKTWSPLGNLTSNGVTSSSGVVKSICCDGLNQKIYVGGSFSSVNDSSKVAYACNNVALWDYYNANNSWYPIGVVGLPNNNGTNGSVNTVVLNQTNNAIYLGGNFTSVTDASYTTTTLNIASATCNLNYNLNYAVNLVTPTITNFNNFNVTYLLGGTFQLIDPTSNSSGKFTYSIGNTLIANIVGNTVYINSIGTTTITVTQGQYGYYNIGTVTVSLTVNPATPTFGAFVFTTPQTYVSGATFTLTDPSSNSAGAFSYSSSNTSIATVAGKVVTLTGYGSVVITATQSANGNYTSGTITSSLVVNNIGLTGGGTITPANNVYKQLVFISTGAFTIYATTVVYFLLVAGGGAGGDAGNNRTGGGGGAGGYILNNVGVSLAAGTYTVNVGTGGTKSTAGQITNGGNSSVTLGGTNYVAIGGGYGGSASYTATIGGSGGGGWHGGNQSGAVGITGQGNKGGSGYDSGLNRGDFQGGGGGGATSVGSNGGNHGGSVGSQGSGGAGFTVTSVSGSSSQYLPGFISITNSVGVTGIVSFGGGGGGGYQNLASSGSIYMGGSGGLGGGGSGSYYNYVNNSGVVGVSGVGNTGGGGGGAAYSTGSSPTLYDSGNGSSGVVILTFY
jgi:hypothetical protein